MANPMTPQTPEQIAGKAPTDDEINDAIDAWHRDKNTLFCLAGWLGWSSTEYHAWVMDPKIIPQRPLATRAILRGES